MLDTLINDTNKLFMAPSPSTSEIAQFQEFTRKLDQGMLEKVSEILRSGTVQDHSDLLLTLASQNPMDSRLSCATCHDKRLEDKRDDKITQNQQEAGRILTGMGLLAKPIVHECQEKKEEDELIRKKLEWMKCNALSLDEQVAADAILSDAILSDASILKNLPMESLVYASLAARRPYQTMSFFDAPIDCVGRKGLHLALDFIIKHKAPGDNDYTHQLAEEIRASNSTVSIAINETDLLGRSPLHIACQSGSSDLVNLLLGRGARADLKTAWGSLPLHYAAATGSQRICETLVALAPSSCAERDKVGLTALHLAAVMGHTHVVKFFIEESSSDLNTVAKDRKRTPLTDAIRYGRNYSLIKMLVEAGSDPDLGYPLQLAVQEGRERVVRLLLETGPDLCPAYETNAWIIAFREDDDNMMEILDQHSDFLHGCGRSEVAELLIKAIRERLLNSLGYLAKRLDSLLLNSWATNGETPLITAIGLERIESVKLLLGSAKVNPRIPTVDGCTAWELAMQIGRPDIAELLNLQSGRAKGITKYTS